MGEHNYNQTVINKRNGHPMPSLPAGAVALKTNVEVAMVPKLGLVVVPVEFYVEADGKPFIRNPDDGTLEPVPEGLKVVHPEPNGSLAHEHLDVVGVLSGIYIKGGLVTASGGSVASKVVLGEIPNTRMDLQTFIATAENNLANGDKRGA